MLPDQQRSIDALILAGKLEPAVSLYRTITGTALIGAKMYVYARASELGTATANAARPPVPPVSRAAPPPRVVARPPGIVDPRRDVAAKVAKPTKRAKGGCASLVFWILAGAFLFNFARPFVRTHGFGAFTITGKPYYRTLVRAIEHEKIFTAHLGAPIAVEGNGIWCIDYTTQAGIDTSDCRIPVRGPRLDAYVHASTEAGPAGLRSKLTLRHLGVDYPALFTERPQPKKSGTFPRSK